MDDKAETEQKIAVDKYHYWYSWLEIHAKFGLVFKDKLNNRYIVCGCILVKILRKRN